MKRRGQITIFIIVAIMIIVLVAIFLMFRKDIAIPGGGGGTAEKNPSSYLETCLEDSVKETIDIISLQGGSLEPELYKSFRFEGENERKITYLCYNQNYYLPCVNQEPLLIKHLEDEIKSNIEGDVRSCFDSLTSSLDKQGYTVEVKGYRNFDLTLMPKKVKININAEIVLTKSGKRETQNNFEAYVPTQLYGLANVAQEIVNQQGRFCSFNELGYMLTYPDWSINEFMTGDSTIIYSLENRKINEKFRFAVRGCVIPPGI